MDVAAPDPGARLTPELITSTWEPADVRLSPDGTRAVWVAAPHGKEGEHPESGLWWAPVDGSAGARRLTRGGADTAPRWSPDGTLLAFLSDRAERGTAGLYVLDPTGGEAAGAAVGKRAVAAHAWSPDSARLAFLAPDAPDDEDERRTKERDDAEVFGERVAFNRLSTVAAGGGEVTALPIGDLHPTELAWSPDGTRIALLARPTPELDLSTDTAVYLVTMAAAGTTPAHSTGSTTSAGPDLVRLASTPWAAELCWTADGSRVIVLGKQTPSLQSSATVWALPATGDPTPLPVGPLLDEPVCALHVRAPAPAAGAAATSSAAASSAATSSAAGSSAAGSGTDIPAGVAVTVAEGIETRVEWRAPAAPPAVLWEPTGEVEDFDVALTGSGPVLAAVAAIDSGPFEVWAGTPAGMRRLSDHHAAWAGIRFGEVRELVSATADGLELHSVVVLPVDAGAGPHPTVVLPHGGPYWRMARNLHCAWHDWSQLLAVAGYAVLLPNFRGGSGHGNAFSIAVNGNPGVEFDDVEAVVASAVAEGITDPERLGIGGWSNGGFLTAWAVTHSDRYRAAVMGAGVSSWPTMSMTSDVPTFTGDVAGGSPWSPDPGRSLEHSPILHADRVRTPLLMVHGKEDVRVPLSQSIGLQRALRGSDVEVGLVVYPREPHGIAERRHQVDLMERVVAWFARHLGSTAAPVDHAGSTAAADSTGSAGSTEPVDPPAPEGTPTTG